MLRETGAVADFIRARVRLDMAALLAAAEGRT
jgi:hypothetical protein